MKIAVLLSGGVDSSVALRLLRDQGHELTAFYLKIWLEDELAYLGDCPWEDDLGYARAACRQVDVPLEVISMQRVYHDTVVSFTLAELRAGRTPSPDVLCNQSIKFGAFLDHVDQLSGAAFDAIASGHYARLEHRQGETWLLKGVDAVKDQTYFLYRLNQTQLRRCVFPLGGYTKSEVRQLARDYALTNRDRKDSQGICFLGKIRYDAFVREYLGEQPGEIREIVSERCLGEHRGYWFHTIGQRKGLGLSGGPWYVTRKDVERNVIYVSHGERAAEHRRDHFRIPDLHWIGGAPVKTDLQVKLRHSPQTDDCRLSRNTGHAYEVRLRGGDAGIASGQSAVLYQADRCLGGGMIEEVV